MAAQAPLRHAPAPLTTATALDMYVRGDRAVVARNAPAYLPPIWNIADDLIHLKTGAVVESVPAPEAGRAVAAFALETARALETQDPPTVCKIVGATRSRWLKAGSKDEFTRRWHAAAIAVLLRGDCLPALELEVTAAVADFPTESRFRLARAIVAEGQLSAALSGGRQPSGREVRDAETRFKIAMALPPAGEAALRWARVNALLGQHEQAIGLTADAIASPDPRLRYLAHLFRGWSLAALGKMDEADSEYGQALAIVPNAQSATLARAAAGLRNRHAERAEQMVASLISRREPVDDPWWAYAIADGRNVDQLIADLRQVIR
jgi:tetratricopeptide (TPR) repeat protein